METADIPMYQQSSHVEITIEDNAHHFFDSRALFTLNLFHKAEQ
jgi:hypothetical protein